MRDVEPYSYVVLRYMHDVWAGEFVNIGLVMAVPGQRLVLARVNEAVGRVRAVFPNLDCDAYERAIDAVKTGMSRIQRDEDAREDGRSALELARLVVPLDDSVLQWSPPGSGISESPSDTFDGLYGRFVSRYEEARSDVKGRPRRVGRRQRSDSEVWRPVNMALRRRNVKVELGPKRFDGRTDSVEFRHALKNGRWHAYEPVSFDLAGADGIRDKARRWLGNLVAVREGVPGDCHVHFIVGRPRRPSLSDAYGNALEILRQVPFENDVFEDDQVDEVVDQIEEVSRRG